MLLLNYCPKKTDSGDCTTVATQPRQLHYSNNLSKNTHFFQKYPPLTTHTLSIFVLFPPTPLTLTPRLHLYLTPILFLSDACMYAFF